MKGCHYSPIPYVERWFNKTDLEFMACMTNYTPPEIIDVITYPFHSLGAGLANLFS